MARVRDALRADGVVVWTDEHIEIADHDTWQKSIDLALNDSKSLVVLISEASITDPHIQVQAQTAQGLGLPIFPVLIKDVPSDIPPPSYTTEPYIDVQGDNFFSAMEKLRERLRATIFILPPGQQFNRFNPLNWFRLIWWMFFNSKLLIEYRKYYGRNHMASVMAWGVSTLLWLPIFVILTGIIMDSSLNGETLPSVSPSILLSIVIVTWFISGFWGYKLILKKIYQRVLQMIAGYFMLAVLFAINLGSAGGIASTIALNITTLISGVLAITLSFRLGFILTFGVVLGIFVGCVAFVPVSVISQSTSFSIALLIGISLGILLALVARNLMIFVDKILHTRNPLFNIPLFLALILSNAYIIWVYWLGGAQALGYIS